MIQQELKPMDIGTIFDKTFKLVFDNFKNCLIIFLFYFSINFILNLAVYIPVMIRFSLLISITELFISIVITAILIDLYLKAFLNEEWQLKSSFNYVLRRYVSLLGATMLSALIVIGGILLLIIGAIVFSVFLTFIEPVILYEKKRAGESISRSFKLVSYNFWGILGAIMLFALLFIGILLCLLVLVVIFFATVYFF